MSSVPGLADDARPRLPRGVRLRHDRVRDTWVLLAPERLMMPEGSAVEVLQLCDGKRTIQAIVSQLATTYDADQAEIRADVEALLVDLRSQRMIEL